MTTPPDPLAPVRATLARVGDARPLDDATRAALDEALRVTDAVRAAAATPFALRRALAHRAQVLSLLDRREDAAASYAEALALDLSDGEATVEGIRELLDRFGALETVLDLVPKAVAANPGRRWQLDPVAAEARRRLELERTAPITAEGLGRVRAAVSERLQSLPPCAHDDDRRPVARDTIEALGLDGTTVLRWLADLGACCCDCAVASVKGPREDRGGGSS